MIKKYLLKKIVFIVLSIVFAVLSVVFLGMQMQPIIKHHKYKLLDTKDSQECIIFLEYNQAKKIVQTESVIIYYDLYYYQNKNSLNFSIENGESFHVSPSETRKVDYYLIEKDTEINNFRNGLLTIKFENSRYLKPLNFLMTSLFFALMFIINLCLIFVIKTENKRIENQSQETKKTE